MMHRRNFLEKTGAGLAATFVSPPLLSSADGEVQAIPPPSGVKPGQPVDFAALRNDFPALKTWTYLDTAFIGLLSRQVKAAHERHLDERFRFDSVPNDSSILGVWMNRAERVRQKVATFIGASPDEIAFTLCTGCGSNIALNGIDWRPGDNAVVDDLEYPTDLHILNALRKKGVELRIVRNRDGRRNARTVRRACRQADARLRGVSCQPRKWSAARSQEAGRYHSRQQWVPRRRCGPVCRRHQDRRPLRRTSTSCQESLTSG